ncbi:MAG TPA: CheR family methyltransferase [Longimicrobium sp.]|nr:CheR family methyltransferase [Longimicrobium sp.]
MIHPPETAKTPRKPRVPELRTDAEAVVPIVPEPPRALDTTLRTITPPPRRAPGGFFRDADAFRALAELVPSLFAGKGPDEPVRVWVAGCGTGEEAWSIAILLAEHAATLPHPPAVELFATDTDPVACVRGRTALYLASTVAGVPAARLKRFFAWEGGGYRVSRALREAVLFARHDVLRDPPFARLDLVSCRGLLAAQPAEAQARMMETFHQALRPGGVLFLGPGESAGDGFVPAAEAHPLYRRDAERIHLPDLPGGETATPEGSRT